MNIESFIAVGLPTSLALIMLSMGLTLTRQDFLLVATHPRAFFVGLTAQMLLVPALALMLLQFFDLPLNIAIGILILSYCPGGTTSNLFSYLARGDVSLSISLTAVASFITPFSIPLLTEITLQTMQGSAREIPIPYGLTATRLFVVTVCPLVLGMYLNHKHRTNAQTFQYWLHRFSMILFFGVIVCMIFRLGTDSPELLLEIAAVTIVMATMAMLMGNLLARNFELNAKSKKTITIEVGMQNGAMALIVTQGVLQNTTMSLVPIVYGLLMLLPVGIYVLLNHNESTQSV